MSARREGRESEDRVPQGHRVVTFPSTATYVDKQPTDTHSEFTQNVPAPCPRVRKRMWFRAPADEAPTGCRAGFWRFNRRPAGAATAAGWGGQFLPEGRLRAEQRKGPPDTDLLLPGTSQE